MRGVKGSGAPKATRRRRTAVEAGSKEHADLIRGPLISQIEGLREELSKKEAELASASEWRMDIRKQVEQADSVAKHWKGQADELRGEVNGLRDKVLSLSLTCERMRGYFDGQEDAQPPRMVPEQRETNFGRYRAWNEDNIYNEACRPSGSYGERPKRWYER